MMAEFAGLEDNWGLQAIVRGGSFTSSSDSAISTAQNSCYGLMEMAKDDRDLLFSFPDLFETAAVLTNDELEGLYKPFYPVSDSSPSAESIQLSSIFVPNEVEEKPKEDEQKPTCCPVQSAISSSAPAYTPKYKRRKNQNKRVVLRITAKDLSSDMWAWRKYGQKPIKGSPYPRSYYRCSSSKGCLARKQVEQSCTDPSTFFVTYAEEHSHSQPIRKNALAGTVRHKFPNPKSPSKNTSKSAKSKKDSDASSPASSSAVPSPRTALIASIDINEYNLRSVKQEMSIEEEIGEQIIDGGRSDDNAIFSGTKLDDDFFSGLEDLDELISELANDHLSNKQFPMG